MDAKYSKIFIEAWTDVLKSFSNKRIVSAAVKPPDTAPGSGDIVALIGIIGDIHGQIYMSMNAETGKVLTSEMLGGMEIAQVDEQLVTSAVGEMCNMIMGNACSNISLMNTNVDITPPTVVAGAKLPSFQIKPCYDISFLVEDLEKIDFHVAVKTA